MCEKRCTACKQFKDLANYVNEGKHVLKGRILKYVQPADIEQQIIIKGPNMVVCVGVRTIKLVLNIGSR